MNNVSHDSAKRIIIAGGGTGGHIFPAIAIANALRKLDASVEILFVGAKGKMEMDKVPEAGYRIEGLNIAGYNRSSMMKNLSLPFKMIQSFLQVRGILNHFKPHAVLGVGGYSSFPVLRVAQMRNLPTFLHEANSLGGKSNQMLAKRASVVFVAADGMGKYFPEAKIQKLGNPVRNIFEKKVNKEEALKFFGLKSDRKTVLVTGGSLGAKSINEAIEAALPEFKKRHIQLIWQTGKTFSPTAALAEEESDNIWSNAFISKMENAYAAADVVIARSGAMTIAELCVAGKAAIFVPYPHAAEDHQTKNASALVNKNAALMVTDAKVKEQLMPTLLDLIHDDQKINEMENNIAEMGNTHADLDIASAILNTLQKLNNKK